MEDSNLQLVLFFLMRSLLIILLFLVSLNLLVLRILFQIFFRLFHSIFWNYCLFKSKMIQIACVSYLDLIPLFFSKASYSSYL